MSQQMQGAVRHSEF